MTGVHCAVATLHLVQPAHEKEPCEHALRKHQHGRSCWLSGPLPAVHQVLRRGADDWELRSRLLPEPDLDDVDVAQQRQPFVRKVGCSAGGPADTPTGPVACLPGCCLTHGRMGSDAHCPAAASMLSVWVAGTVP